MKTENITITSAPPETAIPFPSESACIEALCLRVFGAKPVFTERPTPRTDAGWKRYIESGLEIELVKTAEQLERELDEANQRIEDLTASGIHSCHDGCKRPMCVMRRELAEAKDKHARSIIEWGKEITHLTLQRDALAEALRKIRKLKPESFGDHWCNDYALKTDDVHDICDEALATVEPPTP